MSATDLASKLEDVDAQQRAGVAVEPRQKTIRDLVQEMEPQFRRALPKHVDSERFTRLALTALRTVPKLAECSSESILAGLMQAARYGLEIDDVRQQAHLIPRWNKRTGRNEATFQLGYGGVVDLAGRGGITIRTRTVFENDLFQYEDGLEPVLRHIPELKKPRGEPWAYFAVATYSDGRAPECVVMSKTEVEAHRDRFAPRNKQNKIAGPWVEHFESMAHKTLIHKLRKTTPLTIELADALSLEEVPVDVVPVEHLEIAPADLADSTGSTASTVERAAAEQGPGSPPDETGGAAGAHPDDGPPAETSPPQDDDDDPDRRKLAAYLLDEARKADHAAVKTWQADNDIPSNTSTWTAEQITTVIDWIHAEPEQEPAQ